MSANANPDRITLTYSQIIVVALAQVVVFVAALGLSVFIPIYPSWVAAWSALGWMLVGKKSKWPKEGWDVVGAFRLVAHVICWPLVLAK